MENAYSMCRFLRAVSMDCVFCLYTFAVIVTVDHASVRDRTLSPEVDYFEKQPRKI